MPLPQSIQELSDLIGLPATLAMVKAYGGVDLKVPVRTRSGGKTRGDLIALLGTVATERLILNYGGERLAVARCAAALRHQRNIEIIAAYDAGQMPARLARAYGMTERNVRHILKSTIQPPDNPS